MQRGAVVIGISQYRQKSGITDLRFADNDALKFGEQLEQCNFEKVSILSTKKDFLRPTYNTILDEIENFKFHLEEDSLFAFFFAGHGLHIKQGEQDKSFLLPADAHENRPKTWLSLSELREHLQSLPAKNIIVFLDCCRNQPQSSRAIEDNLLTEDFSRDIKLLGKGEKIDSEPEATIVMNSCSAGERAFEWPEKSHGVFTYYLLEGIDHRLSAQKSLTVEYLCEYAQKKTRKWAEKKQKKQTPYFQKFKGAEKIYLTRQKHKSINKKGSKKNEGDNSCELTVKVKGKGEIKPSPGVHKIDLGEKVKLEAIPAVGWAFDSWETKENSFNSSHLSITIEENTEVHANFIKKISGWKRSFHSKKVNDLKLGENDCLYSAGEDGAVKKISLAGDTIWKFSLAAGDKSGSNPAGENNHSAPCNAIAEAKGEVYCGSWQGTVIKVSQDGKKIASLKINAGPIWSMVIDKKEAELLIGCSQNQVKKIPLNSFSKKDMMGITLSGDNFAVNDLALMKGGNDIIIAGGDGSIKRVQGNKVKWKFTDYNGSVNALALNKNGLIFSGDGDLSTRKNTVKRITPEGKEAGVFDQFDDAITDICVSVDNNVAFCASWDGSIRGISGGGKELWQFRDFPGVATSLLCVQGDYLCYGNTKGDIGLLELNS